MNQLAVFEVILPFECNLTNEHANHQSPLEDCRLAMLASLCKWRADSVQPGQRWSIVGKPAVNALGTRPYDSAGNAFDARQ